MRKASYEGEEGLAAPAELHGRVETARSMQENIARAHTELEDVHTELDLRLDADQVVSPEQVRICHGRGIARRPHQSVPRLRTATLSAER